MGSEKGVKRWWTIYCHNDTATWVLEKWICNCLGKSIFSRQQEKQHFTLDFKVAFLIIFWLMQQKYSGKLFLLSFTHIKACLRLLRFPQVEGVDSTESRQTCIFGRHRLVSFLRWPNLSHDSWAVDSVLARWLWKNRAHYQDCTRPRLASQLTQFLWLCSRIRCELATTQRLCVAKSTVKMCCASPCRLAELLSNWPWNHGLLD